MNIKKAVKRVAVGIVVLCICYFFPLFVIGFVALGIYDVSRNRPLDGRVIKQYFLGNGILTWILSPVNTLLDLLTLPFLNKKVYKISDLPQKYRNEIEKIVDHAKKKDVAGLLEQKMEGNPRGMNFFKWYGKNIESSVSIPEFNEPYKYIKTIGISVFNKKVSTKPHFGPFRATLRVLYNINDVDEPDSFIRINGVTNRWCENKLFIFDDTLQHQSINEIEKVRYCLFVDILRPSFFPWLLSGFVNVVGFLLIGVNHVFYKNWTPLK